MNKTEMKEWAQDELLAFARKAIIANDDAHCGLSETHKKLRSDALMKQYLRIEKFFGIDRN